MRLSLISLIASVVVFSLNPCIADNTPITDQNIMQRYADLSSLNDTVNYLTSQINSKNAELSKEYNETKKVKLEKEISELNSKLTASKISFANTIADVNLFSDDEENPSKPKEQQDLLKELQELLIPFIDSIKNATKSPRKIEKLRNQIEFIDTRNAQAEEALANISRIESMDQFKDVKKNIEVSKQMIQKVIADNNILKSMYKRDLDKALKGQTSFFALADMIHGFFATKGRNLLLALSTGIIVAFILRLLKRVFLRIKLFNKRQYTFRKTFNALYGIFIWVLSVFAGIGTLYIMSDWFLFSLSLLILVAIFWSLKTYLPRFITEVKLIMDLGYVKEGQRIVWNNCPWIVKRLGMSVHLENEYLDSRIRILPIKEISPLYSRPIVENEPLFPSRSGDFVMLSDGTYGKILTQTCENVAIAPYPMIRMILPVQEYLSLKPRNYSNGFCVKATLSIDYKHQKDISGIEEFLKNDLSSMLKENQSFPKEYFGKPIIEFKEPSSSSLDLFVLVVCDGKLAPDYFKVCRLINSLLLKLCSKHELSIPFPHLQVVMDK